MRRLDILLIGRSPALTELALELEQHGHSLTHLEGLDQPTPVSVDLIIDDVSLTFTHPVDTLRLTLSLGVGAGSASGLPSLDLLCTLGSTLLTRMPLAEEPSGNGQALRLRAMAKIVEHVALLVSRLPTLTT